MDTKIAFQPILCGLAVWMVCWLPGMLSCLVNAVANIGDAFRPFQFNRFLARTYIISPAVKLRLIAVGAAFIGLGVLATLSE